MQIITKPINDTIETLKQRFGIILLLSIPMLIAYGILLFLPAPTYITLGSVYLRSGSLGEIDIQGALIIIIGFLVSMFIITDAIVNINIVVREEKTKTKLGKEIIEAIWKYSGKIFLLFVALELLLFVIQMITIDLEAHYVLYPLIGLIIFSLFFFVPSAMVIDQVNLRKAIISSINMLRYHWHLIVIWLLTGFLLISLIEGILFLIGLPSITVLIINTLLIFPFLIVLQSHLYMQKYPLSP